jgi:hypothetical protein
MPERTNHTYWIDGPGQVTRDNYTGISGNRLPVTGGNVETTSQYDEYNQKIFIYPDLANGVSTYDPSTNLYSQPTVSGTAPSPVLTYPTSAYNSLDHKIYVQGGLTAGSNCDGTPASAIYTFDVASSTWAAVTTHNDPITGLSPPARLWNGWAYSPTDNIFLLASGCTSTAGGTLTDTWAFHPDTGNWEQLSPSTVYAPLSGSGNTPFERLAYDVNNNVFIMSLYGDSTDYTGGSVDYSQAIWAYCYSACPNAGRDVPVYTPAPGYINTHFTGSAIEPNGQVDEGSTNSTSIVANGSTIYAAWIESGTPFDQNSSSDERSRHPYVQASSNGTTWTGLGGSWNSLDSASTESEQLHLAIVAGTPWAVWSNTPNNTIGRQLNVSSWSGSAWNTPVIIGPVGGVNHYRGISSITPIGSTAAVASIEASESAFTADAYVDVCSGTACPQLGGSLTVNPGGRPLAVDITSDGSNPYVCQTEEIASVSFSLVTLTPQLYCHYWTGSAWSQIGGSLNQSATNWAADPSVTYFGGHLYVAYTERATGGNPKLYVYSCTTTACALIGNDIRNSSTGWPWNPRLASDGATLYLNWEEQSSSGENAILRSQSYNGSSWTALSGALNADPANGSAAYNSLAVVSGKPTALWTEITPGNLRQVYIKQWNGTQWAAALGLVSGVAGSTAGGNATVNGAVRIH